MSRSSLVENFVLSDLTDDSILLTSHRLLHLQSFHLTSDSVASHENYRELRVEFLLPIQLCH